VLIAVDYGNSRLVASLHKLTSFSVSEWVEVQTVRGYFSRLASQQKGLPISEEEGEDEALEKEDYIEQLVGVAKQEAPSCI